MATGLLTTSCDTDNVAELYNAQQENVAMQTATIALKQSEADGEYSVQVVRSKTQGEYTAAYNFKGDDVFTDEGHGSVTFADGQGTAVIKVKAQNMDFGNTYSFTVELADDVKATTDTTIHHSGTTGNVYATTLSVTRDYEWEELGTGKLTSESMGDDSGNPSTWEVQVLKAKGYDVYKAVDCYEKGYDVMFKVNSDNTVTVPQQKAWTYTGHGPVAVVGTGTKTGNVLDCKLHHIVLSLNHDLGAYSEILTLPEK